MQVLNPGSGLWIIRLSARDLPLPFFKPSLYRAPKIILNENPVSAVSLFLAPWVVPISSPVIADGAVAIRDGRILAVGDASILQSQFAEARVDGCQGVLLPGLVNAHIHLELSAYNHTPRPTPDQSFCDWIRALLKLRQAGDISAHETVRSARQMLEQQRNAGTALLLDIGNNILAPPASMQTPVEINFLLELLGPDAKAEEQVLARIGSLPDVVSATAHAPYSTTAGIMKALKKRADRLGHIFSLHVAESVDEVALLRTGQGCFREFLEERGAWDGRFPRPGKKIQGVVEYLADLGLLDANLLCVHCVQVNEQEVQLLAEHGCKICLCPGSNRFLGVGVAPLERMLHHGLLPAIGTDSMASNESLDLWREMRILREDHPCVSPARILTMATLGGAQAMGRAQDFGTLAPGRMAGLLNVNSPALQRAQDAEQLIDILTGHGQPDKLCWISGNGNATV
ncbi:MAG: cytosine deaminase-like metal-dependent [Desulfobulbaceae bacterium]|nr:MAG: cytosine deaminase-like metal-dependent [Desulfobulbaceae bacterium]